MTGGLLLPHAVRTVSAHLSPARAAHRAGTSRWSILRAIKGAELRAIRDNRGAWQIEPEDLDAWSASRARTGAPSVRALPPHTFAAHPAEAEAAALRVEVSELRSEAAGLRAEAAGLRDRLADTAADRDAWRELASRPWWSRFLPRR